MRRSRRGWARLFASGLLAMALAPVAVYTLARTFGVPGVAELAVSSWVLCWLLGAPLAALASVLASLPLSRGTGRVEANATELRFEVPGARPRVVPRDDIESILSRDGFEYGVEIALSNGDALELVLSSDAQERAIIDALGFGTLERRAVVALGGPRSALRVGCGGLLLAVLTTMFSACGLALTDVPYHVVGDNIGDVMAFVFVAASLFFVGVLRPGRVIVGADGLVLERRFRKTFIPVAWLFGAELSERGVVVSINQNGAIRQLVLTSERNGSLVKRIGDAIRAKEDRPRVRMSALLARGGRSLEAWREGLLGLASGSGGYRGEAAPLDLLCRTASSAALPAEQRLGAAIAVGLAGDPESKRQLRIAVEGIANEKLRIAMNGALEGDLEEEALQDALGPSSRARE